MLDRDVCICVCVICFVIEDLLCGAVRLEGVLSIEVLLFCVYIKGCGACVHVFVVVASLTSHVFNVP